MTRCYETTKWFYPYLSLLVLSIQHFARFSALGDVQLTPNVFRISWFLLHLIRKLHCGVLHWDLLLGEAGRAGWRPQGAVRAPRLAGWAIWRKPKSILCGCYVILLGEPQSLSSAHWAIMHGI